MQQRGLFDDPAPANEPRDPCASKHGGAETSVAAWERQKQRLGIDQTMVLGFIRECGRGGATAKEVAAHLDKPLHAVSGRCTELKAMGLVRKLTDSDGQTVSRDGSAVLVAM